MEFSMKTKEELIEMKMEYETMNEKLAELSDDELEQVTGGQYVNHDYPSLKALDNLNRQAKSKSRLIEQISTGTIINYEKDTPISIDPKSVK